MKCCDIKFLLYLKFTSPSWGTHSVSYFFLPSRAEPLLARIKADRTVVVSPVFDKVHFDDLHVERYIPASHAFDWALWCMYESFSPQWVKMADESQPGKYVEQAVFYLAI